MAINVVSAASLGCSPDVVTSPDLRVIVRLDGQVALQTGKASDRSEPLFAEIVSMAAPAAPVQVTIEVQEAEPGGFFGLGTTWEDCDTAAGPSVAHTFTWSGEARTVVARGDGSNAAEATVVLGGGAPAKPALAVSGLTPSSAVLSWDAVPDGQTHRLFWGGFGDRIADLPAGTGEHILSGLCENRGYSVRLVRDLFPWRVGSGDVSFQTPNGVPDAPRILSAATSGGNVSVRIEFPYPDDLARVEVFGGAGPGVATDGVPLAANSTGPWGFERTVTVPAGSAYLRAKVTDTGGLSSESQAFRADGAGLAAGPTSPCSGSSVLGRSDLQPLPDREDLGVDGGPGTQGEDRDSPASGSSGPSFPLNGLTLGLAVVAALLLGAVIGLLLRQR